MPRYLSTDPNAGEPAGGMVQPGNIDLSKRPRVRNKDGTVSTVRSIGVNVDGVEVLIPTVSDDGRIMSDDEAVRTFKRTGKHLGTFETPEASTAFAERLHESEAAKLEKPKKRYLSTDPNAGAPAKEKKGAVRRYGEALYEGTIGAVPGMVKLGVELSHPDMGRRAAAASGLYEGAVSASGDQFGKAGAALQEAAPDDTTEMVVRAITGGALGGRELAAAGHAAAGVVPMIGPAAASAGEKFAAGDVAGGAGETTALLLPGAAGKMTKAGGAVARGTANVARNTSEWLARSAVKPLVSSMKRVAGASSTGVEAQAQKLVRFIIDERIATPEKAAKIITETERELQGVLSAKNAPTDAATRANRYLEMLERRFKKAGNAEGKAAAVRAKAEELLRSQLGETVTKDTTKAVRVPGGQVEITTTKDVRQLRERVPATEAMERARASSKASTSDQWGDVKGVEIEANKAVERGYRDAVKAAVPEAKPLLQRQGKAIQAREALDRMAFREANREPLGLSTVIVAGQEMAQGRPPVMAMAAEILRGSKLRGSFALDSARRLLEKAVAAGNAPEAAHILTRLGVSVSPRDLKPVRALPRAAKRDNEEDQPRSRVATR